MAHTNSETSANTAQAHGRRAVAHATPEADVPHDVPSHQVIVVVMPTSLHWHSRVSSQWAHLPCAALAALAYISWRSHFTLGGPLHTGRAQSPRCGDQLKPSI